MSHVDLVAAPARIIRRRAGAQAVLVGLLAAAAAAIYPAWRSSRRDPAPLLRED